MPARPLTLPAVLVLAALAGCQSSTSSGADQPPALGEAQRSPTPAPTSGVVRAEPVARGLEHPWALAFLPDGRMLVTERPGRLRVVTAAGAVSAPVAGVPAVFATGQGGLLDVALDPAFAANRLVYLSYAEPGDGGTAGTAVARGRLRDDATALDDVRVVYRQEPKVSGGNHFGSRLVFARDGLLLVTQGDRFSYREQAQELGSLLGKVARVRPEGGAAPGNPFAGRAGAAPEVYSYGHRNVQAAALDPATGRLWTVEHGARGGDELNAPEAGKNYGWPAITYGVDYSGAAIGEGTAKAGLEQPVYYWDPVIAPSGAAFVTSDRYPGWRGSLVVGSLGTRSLVRLELQGRARGARGAAPRRVRPAHPRRAGGARRLPVRGHRRRRRAGGAGGAGRALRRVGRAPGATPPGARTRGQRRWSSTGRGRR
jgi:glucose/arabinose dehydrogenase